MAKNLNNDDIEDVPVVDDALLDNAAELVELPEAPAAALVPTAHGPVAGKRTLGVKEPIVSDEEALHGDRIFRSSRRQFSLKRGTINAAIDDFEESAADSVFEFRWRLASAHELTNSD